MKLVPIEPTGEMLHKAYMYTIKTGSFNATLTGKYCAMTSECPTVEVVDVEEVLREANSDLSELIRSDPSCTLFDEEAELNGLRIALAFSELIKQNGYKIIKECE